MSVKKILLAGNPTLEKPSKKITDFKSRCFDSLMEDLRDTLMDVQKRKQLGRGIAAPQIGMLERAVYIIDDGKHIILINPVISRYSEKKMKVWDSCFSYDLKFFVLVERAREVEVAYQTPEGQEKREMFSGGLSELAQHEIDHLDGILSFKRAITPINIMLHEEWVSAGKPYFVD